MGITNHHRPQRAQELDMSVMTFVSIFATIVTIFFSGAMYLAYTSDRDATARARSEAWVRLVKSTRKVRALRKEALEYKPLGSETWTT